MQKLASCDSKSNILLQVMSQVTDVRSSDAVLFLIRGADGFQHAVLQRSNQKIVVDARLRPGETIRYAVADSHNDKDADLNWVTFSVPLAPPLPATSLQITAHKLQRAFQSVLRNILICNLLISLPTMYYFFLPKGTVIEDENLYFSWILPLSGAVLLIGVPSCIRLILVRRAKGKRYAAEIAALLLCFTPIFFAGGMHTLAGATRTLQLPCAGEDGEENRKWTEGC